jgi:hypothetical protein
MNAKEEMSLRLMEAIERVRLDIAEVEFWVSAVTGFTQPIPDYDPPKLTAWLPWEQGEVLRNGGPASKDS